MGIETIALILFAFCLGWLFEALCLLVIGLYVKHEDEKGGKDDETRDL